MRVRLRGPSGSRSSMVRLASTPHSIGMVSEGVESSSEVDSDVSDELEYGRRTLAEEQEESDWVQVSDGE